MVCDFVCVKYLRWLFILKKDKKKRERKRGRKCQGRCGKECCVVLCESFLDGLHCIG